jgi:hypothetical protein
LPNYSHIGVSQWSEWGNMGKTFFIVIIKLTLFVMRTNSIIIVYVCKIML